MRVILYTGKGGVGKTSIAAATAIKIADEGKKVMILSTDQAHSLGDALECTLSNEPTVITKNLHALEIDVVNESESAWGRVKTYIKDLLTLKAESGIEADELLVFPGLEELFALFRILDVYESGEYDTMIVDCAPTGETLALLKFPEVFGALFEKVIPMKRKAVKKVGPIVEKVARIPMPEESFFDDFEKLMDKLDRMQALMLNKDELSIRIVSTPERIVVKETKRNFTWLQMYDYNVDAIIVNKVYPREALEGYFGHWIILQEKALEELKESFRDIPIFILELQRHEIKSLPLLKEISGFYKQADPDKVLCKKRIFKLLKVDGKQRLEIELPFVEKEEMTLGQSDGEVEIAIRNEKRCFSLPDVVKGKDIVSAKLENGVLALEFA